MGAPATAVVNTPTALLVPRAFLSMVWSKHIFQDASRETTLTYLSIPDCPARRQGDDPVRSRLEALLRCPAARADADLVNATLRISQKDGRVEILEAPVDELEFSSRIEMLLDGERRLVRVRVRTVFGCGRLCEAVFSFRGEKKGLGQLRICWNGATAAELQALLEMSDLIREAGCRVADSELATLGIAASEAEATAVIARAAPLYALDLSEADAAPMQEGDSYEVSLDMLLSDDFSPLYDAHTPDTQCIWFRSGRLFVRSTNPWPAVALLGHVRHGPALAQWW